MYNNKDFSVESNSKTLDTPHLSSDLQKLITLELDDLSNSIKLLADNSDVNLNTIPHSDPIYKAFEFVKLAVALFYDTDQYSLITDLISNYPSPPHILPNTAGSFLFGCSQSNYGDVTNRFCSPICIQNIPPSKSLSLVSCCPHQVWSSLDPSNISFTQLSNPSNTNNSAYVYVYLPFNGFSNDTISLFKRHNINLIQVYSLQNSIHHSIIPPTSIDDLALLNPSTPPTSNTNLPSSTTTNLPSSTTNLPSSTTTSNSLPNRNNNSLPNTNNNNSSSTPPKLINTLNTSTSGSSNLWIILIIIIIIIVIVALLLFYRRQLMPNYFT